MMRLTLSKADSIGVMASTLCMIHCIATPFLFIAQSCSAACCSDAPDWWRWIDYGFLVISFFAVYRSARTTSSKWMKPALWLSWTMLLICIINESFEFAKFPEGSTYMAAFLLIGVHLYNLRYCQCKTKECCVK